MGHFLFHLPRSWIGPEGLKPLPFYERLFNELSARDIAWDTCALERDGLLQRVSSDDAFHIVNHGRFAHPRVLNAGIAYIYPFWNMDPLGIRAFSSIGVAKFDPEKIDPQLARPFFRRLRTRLITARRSRYEQPQSIAQLPDNAIAVFLQSEAHRDLGETCYLDSAAMLATVLATTDAPVIVKPHPHDEDPTTLEWLNTLSKLHPNLLVSHTNIHDILAQTSKVVTINSAVGIEAYVHRKPVILCGRADFHHIAHVAKTSEDLVRFLQRNKRARAYDKFIYWYFAQQCLSTVEPDLVNRFLARVKAQGYDV